MGDEEAGTLGQRLFRLRQEWPYEVKCEREKSVVVVAGNYGEFRRWVEACWEEGVAATFGATYRIIKGRASMPGVDVILWGSYEERGDWPAIEALLKGDAETLELQPLDATFTQSFQGS